MIDNDDDVDDLTHSIEDRCYLPRPSTADGDRPPYRRGRIAIVHELERSADLMVNVAKTTRRLYPHSVDPKLREIIQRMGEQAGTETRVAIDAFADADPSAAGALADMDDTMDDLTKSLFRYILAGDGSDESTVLQAVQLALVGRHYERIADHAVTIAQRVCFMVTASTRNLTTSGAGRLRTRSKVSGSS